MGFEGLGLRLRAGSDAIAAAKLRTSFYGYSLKLVNKIGMVYVKKKDRETTASLLRRFTRRVQQSGVLLSARRSRFYRPKPTRRQLREKALRRLELLKERQRLVKLGKLKETRR